jgi:ketosteroid isomerase-like protein
MVRERFLLIIVCASICTGSVFAAAQQSAGSGVRAKILALEAAWNKAANEADVQAMQTLLDSTMVQVDSDGVLKDKSHLISDLKAASHASFVNQSVDVHVYGDTAVAFGVFSEKGVVEGKPYQRRCRFIATWVFRNGAWVCAGRQANLLPE